MAMNGSGKSYQNFEPRFDWVHHPDSHVLIVPLLGFKTNQLKIQVTSTGKLRISGERKLESRKWLRFQKEIEVPADADADKISAKMEDGVLYLRQPKKPTATSKKPPEKSEPKAQTLPPAVAEKPKAETSPPAEAPKPAAAKPTADPPTVRQNASKSQKDKSKPQAIGKQPTPPPKDEAPPKPARTQKSAEKPQPDQEAAVKNSTDDQKQTDGKSEAHSKLKDGLEEKEGSGSKMAEEVNEGSGSKMAEEVKEGSGSKMAEEVKEGRGSKVAEEVKEGSGSKMAEEVKEGSGSKMAAAEEGGGGRGRGEKEGGVAEERRGKKRRGGMVEGGRSGFKLKEVRRTTMAALVLGVVAVVIFYLNVTKKGNVEGEL